MFNRVFGFNSDQVELSPALINYLTFKYSTEAKNWQNDLVEAAKKAEKEKAELEAKTYTPIDFSANNEKRAELARINLASFIDKKAADEWRIHNTLFPPNWMHNPYSVTGNIRISLPEVSYGSMVGFNSDATDVLQKEIQELKTTIQNLKEDILVMSKLTFYEIIKNEANRILKFLKQR